jgi:hypothetical protein
MFQTNFAGKNNAHFISITLFLREYGFQDDKARTVGPILTELADSFFYL